MKVKKKLLCFTIQCLLLLGMATNVNTTSSDYGDAKVSASLKRTVTLTSIFSKSPRCVGYYKVGQKGKNTSRYIVTVYNNCTTGQKYVTSNFSYGPYDTYRVFGI